jgi:Leucine-rich repeat (LRR) protein
MTPPVEEWTLLTSLTKLQLLDLRRTNVATVQGSFWAALSTQLTRLTSLDISDPMTEAAPSPASLAPLSQLRSLQQLSMAGVYLNASELNSLPALPIVSCSIELPYDLEEGTGICDWLLRSASGIHQLELTGPVTFNATLDYLLDGTEEHSCDMRPILAALVKTTPQLENLLVRRQCIAEGAQQLAQLTQLTSLTLCDCHMSDLAVSKLSALSALRELSLQNNHGFTGAEGSMASLAAGLPQLTSLNLEGTGAQEAGEEAFGARILALGLTLRLAEADLIA